MSVKTPPRPGAPISREEAEALFEALIEEARRRTRRRRQKYAASAVAASLVAVAITTILPRSMGEQDAALALAARSSVAAGANAKIAFITGPRTHCTNPPTCTPPASPGPGKLYVVKADGSGLRLVAEQVSSASPPVWSPDGQRLAFNGPRGAYTVNVDGSGLQKLASGGVGPWSPDGQKVVFARVVNAPAQWTTPNGPNSEIFVMNADGNGARNLTRNPKFDADPAWSPDGQQIAFRRVVGVVRCGTGGCGGAQSDVFVMDADGSRQQRLIRDKADDRDQSWSPDGTQITFRRDWDIFVVNADGSGLRNLTRNRSRDMDADWSPDGEKIVFRTSRHGRWELYVMNADGTGQQRLTHTAANESRPSWSADGRQIAFTREVGSSFDLYVMNADGSGQRKLTAPSPVNRWVAFAWSPAPR